LRKECDKVGAKIVYDAAHVFGLIAAGYFQNPLSEGADIITSSTHKTFPGPQGGIILGNIDNNLAKKIQKGVFPKFSSNHHLHRVPALHVALMEMKKYGKNYASQIIKNSKALAKELNRFGFDVLGERKGFTESHQVVVDVEKHGRGERVALLLEKANIILNKNIIVRDKMNAKNPSGIRMGVQEMTRFGMKETEMKRIAEFIKRVVLNKENPETIKKEVIKFRKKFQKVRYC